MFFDNVLAWIMVDTIIKKHCVHIFWITFNTQRLQILEPKYQFQVARRCDVPLDIFGASHPQETKPTSFLLVWTCGAVPHVELRTQESAIDTMISTFKTAKEIIETSSVVFVVEIITTSSRIIFSWNIVYERDVFWQIVSLDYGGVDDRKTSRSYSLDQV